jgi:deoxyribodipyrimidine photolyase-related protein
VPNALWLTTDEEFDTWAAGRKALRLEYFYRSARKQRDWLMDDGEPAGGRWNYDADNRQTPEAGHAFPEPPRFEPDALTQSVMEEVQAAYPGHFGAVEGFNWPSTASSRQTSWV